MYHPHKKVNNTFGLIRLRSNDHLDISCWAKIIRLRLRPLVCYYLKKKLFHFLSFIISKNNSSPAGNKTFVLSWLFPEQVTLIILYEAFFSEMEFANSCPSTAGLAGLFRAREPESVEPFQPHFVILAVGWLGYLWKMWWCSNLV